MGFSQGVRDRARVANMFCCFFLVAGVSACKGRDSDASAGTPGSKTSSNNIPSAIPSVLPSPSPTTEPTAPNQVYKGPAEVNPFVLKFIDDAKIQGKDV